MGPEPIHSPADALASRPSCSPSSARPFIASSRPRRRLARPRAHPEGPGAPLNVALGSPSPRPRSWPSRPCPRPPRRAARPGDKGARIEREAAPVLVYFEKDRNVRELVGSKSSSRRRRIAWNASTSAGTMPRIDFVMLQPSASGTSCRRLRGGSRPGGYEALVAPTSRASWQSSSTFVSDASRSPPFKFRWPKGARASCPRWTRQAARSPDREWTSSVKKPCDVRPGGPDSAGSKRASQSAYARCRSTSAAVGSSSPSKPAGRTAPCREDRPGVRRGASEAIVTLAAPLLRRLGEIAAVKLAGRADRQTLEL